MSPNQRIATLAVAAVVAVVAFIVLKPSDDNNKAKTTTVTKTQTSTAAPTDTTPKTSSTPAPAPGEPVVTVENAKPKGGIQKIKVSKGDQVRFKIVSDTADEIHVHGYNLMKDVKAGGSVSFDFKATIDGAFDIELEGRGEQIAQLNVEP